MKRTKDPRNIQIRTVSIRHPFGVKPQGNSWLQDPQLLFQQRKTGLGYLSVLSDETIMYMLNSIDDLNSLKSLMMVCTHLYGFLHDEDLWKKLYNKHVGDSRPWKGSWKKTVLNWDHDVNIRLVLNSDVMYRPFQVANIDYGSLFSGLVEDEQNMKRMNVNGEGRIPRHSFLSDEEFDDIKTPFILTGHIWPKWTLESLNSDYGDTKFQQESVNWTLRRFIEYCKSNNDESPLYLFDCRSKAMDELRSQYATPQVFQNDYFKLLGGSRPDHSWLIIGSKRSGSTFHKDPNNTSAWNACITGKKLWVMLPPGITPPGVTVSEDQSEITSPVGIGEWVLSGFYHDVLRIPEALIGITFPGECMYVPSNWWHLVINLDDSIAITENFVPKKDLNNVLNFFENKPKQISGFKLGDIKELIKELPGRNSELSEFLSILNESSIDLYEDCGEISDLPDIPMYEVFKQLLINDGYQSLVDQYLNKPKKPKNNWSNLNTSSSDGFSFNFAIN